MPHARHASLLTSSWLLLVLGCSPAAQPAAVEPAPVPAPAATESATPTPAPAPTGSASSDPATPRGAARDKPDIPPPGSPLDRVMQAHFQDALLIRRAVIEGTPEKAADPASVFLELGDLDKLPHGWQGFVQRMQEAARRITTSTSAAQTAAATADLGVSCGMCHEEHGGPKAAYGPAPEQGATVATRMQRHIWATERLWEGLFVPSSDAWDAGIKALSTDPFPKDLLKTGGVHLRSAATEMIKLVAKAPQRKQVEDRAALYAEMLVTCGACHQAVNNKD